MILVSLDTTIEETFTRSVGKFAFGYSIYVGMISLTDRYVYVYLDGNPVNFNSPSTNVYTNLGIETSILFLLSYSIRAYY